MYSDDSVPSLIVLPGLVPGIHGNNVRVAKFVAGRDELGMITR